MMSTTAWYVMRAADAPAPSLVIDGSALSLDASRDAFRAVANEVRAEVLHNYGEVPGLGVKTIVIRPLPGARLRAEFFQGYAHGPLMSQSPQTCINSLACAVATARIWFAQFVTAPAVVAVMGDCEYILRPEVSSEWNAADRAARQ